MCHLCSRLKQYDIRQVLMSGRVGLTLDFGSFGLNAKVPFQSCVVRRALLLAMVSSVYSLPR